ncbi:MAG: toprim domain-containing protein [Burkholderiaceae bacterium]|nr:toprim domain-containing protein [Burkholderiaceae bacterium]
MKNYNDVLLQLQLTGLRVDFLDIDGKVKRCAVNGSKERKGWYLLHLWRTSQGDEYVVGSYGIWSGNSNNAIKVDIAKEVQLDASERAPLKARLAEDKKRAAAQRADEAQRAAYRAANVWAKGLQSPPGDAPADYLSRKKVSDYGLRYSASGALMVPMMDSTGAIKGLQKQGHWFQIGSVYAGGVCLLAEGYATGATLHAATGLPVAVAFDAGNLLPVALALKKAHKVQRILVCADDDYLQKCQHCGQKTEVATPECSHCGQAHGQDNPGCKAASTAAMAVAGAWVAPVFPGDRGGQKLTDFNDLQALPQGGLALVRTQIEAQIAKEGWATASGAVRLPPKQGGGESLGSPEMLSRISIDDAALRYVGTYGMGGKVLFDTEERRLIAKDDAMNLLPSHGWDLLKNHPQWRVVRDHEIGFDPTERDPSVKCNMWGGWPTQPKEGQCTVLLDLLGYLCGKEPEAAKVYEWILKWLAYPIQHPGAKMHSAIVVHGPQGTGKSRFFEAYSKIFGVYGRVLGQEALEDKFNADWAEKKLFILADEVLARQDMFHIKNRLKGLITCETIRVNPKNIAAHNEKNQMNIVFLSNERMPLVLENDDRRHCVIWVPPKLSQEFFADVDAEIDAGGVEALHHYLLHLPLDGFKPWTKPPMTWAKNDLIQQSLSSEERFLADWMALEIDGLHGEPLPFIPCLGSDLYRAYVRWCNGQGERPRRKQDVIGLAGKLDGWRAGMAVSTWATLQDTAIKSRKMVVPSDVDMAKSLKHCTSGYQEKYLRERFAVKSEWLTACYFQFLKAVGPVAQ